MNTKLLISLWGRLTNRLFREGRQNDVPSEPTHSLRKDITEKIDVKTENLEKMDHNTHSFDLACKFVRSFET